MNKKEAELLQKLRKLPDNKKCVDCGQKGTTYIITNFGIFTCSICAALHREVNHKAKGIGMSNFTAEELLLVEEFGNKNFNLLFMGRHNAIHHPIPQNSDRTKMKSFLENKYIRKLFYQKKRTIDEPPLEPEQTYEQKPEPKTTRVKGSRKEERKHPERDIRPRASENAIVVAQGTLLDLTEEQPKSIPVTKSTFDTSPAPSWSAFSQQAQPPVQQAPQPRAQPAPQPSLLEQSPSSQSSASGQPSLFQIEATGPTQPAPSQPAPPPPQRNSLLQAFSVPNNQPPAAQPNPAPNMWNSGQLNNGQHEPKLDMASILKSAYSAAANQNNNQQEQQKQRLFMVRNSSRQTIQQQHQMLGQLARSALSNPGPYLQLQHTLLLQQQQLLSMMQDVKNPFDSLI